MAAWIKEVALSSYRRARKVGGKRERNRKGNLKKVTVCKDKHSTRTIGHISYIQYLGVMLPLAIKQDENIALSI